MNMEYLNFEPFPNHGKKEETRLRLKQLCLVKKYIF